MNWETFFAEKQKCVLIQKLKEIWTTRTIELEGIEFQRHPQDLETLLNFETKADMFDFQKSLNIDASNNEP